MLKIGDYQDEQSVLDGGVTRKVGIKVLDGTEEWRKVSNYNVYYTYIEGALSCNPPKKGFSTHFIGTSESNANMPDGSIKQTYASGTDNGVISIKYNNIASVENWKQWLATQYANGTPVIIVYPLSVATTETVTGQVLLKSPVTQTAGSISNLPIEVEEE